MPTSSVLSSAWLPALALLPTLLALAGAAAIGPRGEADRAWRVASAASWLMVLAAVLAAAVLALSGPASSGWLRLDGAGAAVGLLVAFIGAVIVRFSRHYLAGEPGQARHARWLLLTLGSVGVVVASNHLLLLALGWMGTSAAMHRLLLFYGDRPAAVVAAHKKFISARLADALVLLAAVLLATSLGTLRIDALGAAAAREGWPLAAQAAVALVALAALLKCAQLPFNGWLIQVMEAPTPVSALLHAGVVNLGGFVLLRLAPLVDAVPLAQGLLVVVGTASAALAALVATTRISIKVSLAWSTCAQMGFMLVQCGLGLWEMALLHLLAHSLYKAHSFLGAGDVVRQSLVGRLGGPAPAAAAGPTLLTGAAAVAALLLGTAVLMPAALHSPQALAMAAVFALTLVPLLRPEAAARPLAAMVASVAAAVAVSALWLWLHALTATLMPGAAAAGAWWPVPALGFGLLFVVQTLVTTQPGSALARRLHPWCYGGLYLDERLHRGLFRLLPLPPAARPASTAQTL